MINSNFKFSVLNFSSNQNDLRTNYYFFIFVIELKFII